MIRGSSLPQIALALLIMCLTEPANVQINRYARLPGGGKDTAVILEVVPTVVTARFQADDENTIL